MNVTLPVLVTEQKQKSSPAPLQVVRPLFLPGLQEQAESLQRALNKLVGAVRQQIEKLGEEARHDRIAEICFAPTITGKVIHFKLNLGAENFDCRYFFAVFAGFNKKLAFTPNVPDVWFEIDRGEDLQFRAETVLDEHFRRLERRDGRGTQNPARYNFVGKTWLTSIDFTVSLPLKHQPPEQNFFAFLGAAGKMNGAEELRKTGRHLDSLFPTELERTTGRTAELERLTEFLEARDQRPVLIVGRRQTGKTALIHEYVFRTVEKRSSPRQGERNTWLLAPQRLVSGMMFVGQWEERLLAILDEAKAKRHLLYFDDLLGLFLAGQSANSDLSVAAVLKPCVERRDVRVVAEITPEAFRVLQERDRSFADLFQIVRLEETNNDETLKIILSVRRELEQKHRCFFELEALPTALDLQRRYVRDAAFPGKAAVFLRQLAAKFSEKAIGREDVLREFTQKSGMSVRFLDDKAKLDREDVIKKIGDGIIGQDAAIAAAADAISIAKARLNDATRPIASFLFLGATGVGKTEAAKQIAAYLYGDAEKLLRFDMNEFVSPFDAARLVGTFDQPEGLLTSAVRRQPFSVILLDEIEKAHPDVFNLLLQVMGDGRLTDALGRTADFTNAILILTSNLGAREANAKLGFRQTNESQSHVFVSAAEKFFKPEFVNRFDRIVAFEKLRQTDVEQIAEKQLQKVFSRDGLLRRNCQLKIQPEAMQLIVNEGYHPELGARALKRALEKLLIQPVARRLAALSPDAPIVVRVAAENDEIVTQVEEVKLPEIARSVWLVGDFSDVDTELDLIADALDRIEEAIEPFKPAGEISPHDERGAAYFLVREHIGRIERMIARAERWFERTETAANNSKPKNQTSKRQLVTLRESNVDFEKLLSASNLAFRFKDLAAENRVFGEKIEDYLTDIWRETALLQALANNIDEPNGDKCVLQIEADDTSYAVFAQKLSSLYRELFRGEIGLKVTEGEDQTLILEGVHAFALAKAEVGNHLFITEHAGFVPVAVRIAARGDVKTPVETGVLRVYDGRGRDLMMTLDFRSGLLASDRLTPRELRTFVLSGLPLPQERASPL